MEGICYYLLKDFGGSFLFKCNYDVNEYNINSIFYKELLQWWADLRACRLFDRTANF